MRLLYCVHCHISQWPLRYVFSNHQNSPNPPQTDNSTPAQAHPSATHNTAHSNQPYKHAKAHKSPQPTHNSALIPAHKPPRPYSKNTDTNSAPK